tara:strand:+ start:1228 stop:1689 length:462 start_codon:yes stop_codon:yes gene_type:complete
MSTINEWGPASWYIFHTLAEKCKEEYYNELKDDLISFFKLLCYNLPCENCRNHAINTFKTIIIKNIDTKDKFKRMLLEFHNKVNKLNGKVLFTEDDLNNKYSKANTLHIIEYFFYIWRKTNTNSKLMMNSLYKNRFLQKFEDFLNNNILKFDL